jgi:glyceraldehyde-3-phosphate dehydrogenase (NAD(P))
MGLVKGGLGIKSTAELKEYALDMGRPRGDLWESCILRRLHRRSGKGRLLLPGHPPGG